ncbi:ATP-binding protein [Streptomyces sp. NBC_01304]|nr:ATP-binding protein [Streptomyces sp. NBC_01304]
MNASTPLGTRRCLFEVAARPDSVAQARRMTRDQLTGWALGDDTCDAAALVVSELVTNAVVHTVSRRIVCELSDGGGSAGEDGENAEGGTAGRLRIVVRDEGPGEGGPPGPHPARAGDEDHGRGLLLVAAMSAAWGAEEYGPGPGLAVWAELPRQPDPVES